MSARRATSVGCSTCSPETRSPSTTRNPAPDTSRLLPSRCRLSPARNTRNRSADRQEPSLPFRRVCPKRAALVVLAALGLAACGGTSTNQVAACFRNALADTNASSGYGYVKNCQSAVAYKVTEGGSGTRFSVSCSHWNGNVYLCDATGPGTQSLYNGGTNIIPGGHFRVTDDGTRVTWRPGGP